MIFEYKNIHVGYNLTENIDKDIRNTMKRIFLPMYFLRLHLHDLH